ncbi:MAG: outer membrane lipoprotein carrier protein LolA [Pseudomonadota bacterium]
MLWTIFATTTLMSVMSCGSSAPFKQGDLAGLLEDMERKAQLVSQFQVRFVKTRSVSAFDRELKVNGRLVFQKPARMSLSLTGDVNVEILSDGRCIKIIHDGTDEETFKLRGDRDMTKFADPLMLLINSVGDGGLRDLAVLKTVEGHDSRMVQIDPSNDSRFERIQTIFLWLSDYGEIGRVRIVFTDGGTDDTVFESWSVLSDDAPEIRELNYKLRTVLAGPAG